MSGYYFNDESLLQISSTIENIKATPGMSEDEKVDTIIKYIDSLEPEKKREYFEFRNYVALSKTLAEDKPIGVPSQCGKIAMVEFDNLQFHYSLSFGMIGAIMYTQARLNDYKASDEAKEHVKDFLKHTFGNHSDKYIGTIYDLYYKKNKEKHATYIPEISPDVLGDAMPTPEQVKNFTDFCTNKLEEVRAVTTALTGYLPSQEAIIRIHGIFDDMGKEFMEYRDKVFFELDRTSTLYPIPVGHVRLMDPYREYRSGINVFNPSEPDVEILNANRLQLTRSQGVEFKKRLQNLDGKLSEEESAALKNYNSQLNELHKLPVKNPEATKKMELIKKQITEIQETAAGDDEVITKVVKVDRNKKKVSIKDKVAKKEGELDIF